MTDDEFVAAVAARVEELELRDQAEHEARRHVRWAFDALIAGDLDEARQRVRWARGALDVWHDIRPDEPPPDLTDEQRARVYRMRRKRLGRLNYWYDERVNPDVEIYAAAAHAALSREFEAAFASHPEAIFAYVRQDARAFRSKWVIDQIERWDAERNADALHKLVTEYANGGGKDKPAAVAAMAARDCGLYAEYRSELAKGNTKTAALMAAAGTSEKDGDYTAARLVCQHYDGYRDHFIALNPSADDAAFLVHLDTLIQAIRKLAEKG